MQESWPAWPCHRGIAMSWQRTLACVLVVWAVGSSGAASQPVRSDQEILIQLERDWNRAFLGKDLGFIERVVADEFVVTYADGDRGDKAKELALAAAFNQQVDSALLDEFIVKIYGDTAVVWFSEHLTGPRQGQPVTITFRYMDVFVLRDGRWQCVASQSTRVDAA